MLHNQKISKSRNWYISLRDFIAAFNPDYLRFYIASVAPYSQTDINFDWDAFSEKINNELIANIGNFINRALFFVQKTFSGRVPEPSSEYDPEDRYSIAEIERIAKEVGFFISVNAVRSLAIMLESFIPLSSERIWSQLGMDGGDGNATNTIHKQQWKSVSQIKIPAGHILGNIEPIFRKIESKEIEIQKAQSSK